MPRPSSALKPAHNAAHAQGHSWHTQPCLSAAAVTEMHKSAASTMKTFGRRKDSADEVDRRAGPGGGRCMAPKAVRSLGLSRRLA